MAVEASSEALYDAFMSPAATGKCREGSGTYTGRFDGQDIGGTVIYLREGAFCKAVVSGDNHLGRRVGPKRNHVRIAVVSAADHGRAYLITPVGIYTATIDAKSLSANVVGRPLQLTLK